MSGSTIPYQLRPNKAVDRQIFIDLLTKLNRWIDISNSHYIGFGSFALEDFKNFHFQLGIQNMTSIEMEEETFKRQKFNQPLTCIDLQMMSSGDFIDSYQRDNDNAIIFWLDYTNPNDLRIQIEEFQSLLLQSEVNDVVKVTLNANPASYHSRQLNTETLRQVELNRYALLEDKLGHLLPQADIEPQMMGYKRFPTALSKVIKNAAESILQGNPDIVFQPLAIFSYADGQQMLTVTGILLERSTMEDFLQKTQITDWVIANTTWAKPRLINLPNFTLKEKLYVDSLLPHYDATHIQEALGFSFTKRPKDSINMIQNYIDFYRYQPFFSRVLI